MPYSYDLAPLIRRHLPQQNPDAFLIEAGALERAAPFLARHLPPGTPQSPWLLVSDETIWPLAGQPLADRLRGLGYPLDAYRIPAAAPRADNAQIDALSERIGQKRPAAVLAVGAGTVNDIAKMAAFAHGLPYAVCPTAPSMNGYTSSVAAILENGVKTTQPSRKPVAVLADLDILRRAPYPLVAAGLGDLLSKPVSGADWRLSHYLLDTPYSAAAVALINDADALIDGIAPRLPTRETQAIARLTACLCLSGLAMELAGSSAPASGGEHLLSHYLDMTHYTGAGPNHLHGSQVGVATLHTAALYRDLAARDPAFFDIEARLAAHPTWPELARDLEAHFGPLSAAVLPFAREKHPSKEGLRRRLRRVRDEWPALMLQVTAELRDPAALRLVLEEAQAPRTFAALGIDAPRAAAAGRWSRHIRPRYTVLDLAAELGLLETWTRGF